MAIVLAVTAGPLLSGCTGAAVEGAVNGAVQGATGGEVSLGGALPAGWPTDIPVVDGEIRFGTATTTDGKQGWVVTITSASADPLAEAKQKLADAGFLVDTGATASVGDAGVVSMKNENYRVVVAGTSDGLLYTVSPAA